MESILTSIKKLLGYEADDTGFDDEIVAEINAVLMSLTQMGVGPSEGFEITDATTTWDAFVPDMKKFGAIKSYVHKRVRLAFDASTMSSSLVECYNRQIAEFEWRLNHAAECNTEN